MNKSTMEKPIAVLDANAFISGRELVELGRSHSLITTQQVLDELRDQRTRTMIENFPHQIQRVIPAKQSVKAVQDFARKTGDINSLSQVDVGLLAVAHQLYLENGQAQQIKTAPPPIKDLIAEQLSQEGSESSEVEDDLEVNDRMNKETASVENNEQPRELSKEEVNDAKEQDVTDKDDEEDGDGWITIPKSRPQRKQSEEDIDQQEGWVTPQNYNKKMAEINTRYASTDRPSQQNLIQLMTADYSMQNVAMQMGIALLSLDGRRISSIRRFIHECYVCWKQYRIEDDKVHLCKQCGYNSLSKVAYSIGSDGQTVLHRKRGWKPNQQVLKWKQKKLEQQQKRKKNQHGRRKKQTSIFDTA